MRGFGPGFNLVTLNGRQLPAAHVGTITGNPTNVGAQGTSRSFDFSTLASEGVSGLEVYKTGNAAAPSGGIGATINIKTIRPLESGNRASIGVKAVYRRRQRQRGDAGSERPLQLGERRRDLWRLGFRFVPGTQDERPWHQRGAVPVPRLQPDAA